MPSNFFWYDLMTPDLEKAANYYCDVVGWGIQTSGAPGMDYRLFTIDDIGVAGLMTGPDGVKVSPPVWSGYIAVDDVDLGAKDIERAGGQVHRGPFEVPDIIRMAVVSDPQGAMFLVAKGLKANRPPMPPVGTSGTVGWHELYAGDGPRAMDFYEKLFGWKRGDALDMGPLVAEIFSMDLFKFQGANGSSKEKTRKAPTLASSRWCNSGRVKVESSWRCGARSAGGQQKANAFF